MEKNLDESKAKCPVSHHKVDLDELGNDPDKPENEEITAPLEDDAPGIDAELSESDGNEEDKYDDDAIHSLLEDGIKTIGEGPVTFKKYVMKQINDIDLHILPEDWLEISHHSGIPVYLDRRKRVISLSRPYHLGQGSVRRHSIPQSAIPCLNYRRSLLKENCPLSYDVGCMTEDIQTANSVADDEIVVRIPSITDSLRLPKCKVKSEVKITDDSKNKLDADKQPSIPENEDTSNKEVPESSAPGPLEVKESVEEQTDVDVEEGEIVSESEDVVEKETEVSRKRSHDSTDHEKSSIQSKPKDTEEPNEVPCKKSRTEAEIAIDNQLANVETSVISVQDKENELLLDPEDVHQYCKRLFEFEEGNKVRFKTLRKKYKFMRIMRKINREKPATCMPENANLIRYKLPPPPDAPPNAKPREFVVNPTGKSFICILHEYCQFAARRPPTYQFKELRNRPTPYSVTVLINGTVYGEGFGDSKRRAKLNAARITLEMIIPGFSKIISQMEEQEASVSESAALGGTQASGGAASAAKAAGLVAASSKATGIGMARGWNGCSAHDLEIFDSISITDRRLQEISTRMALPGPYSILIEYLRRQCINEQSIQVEMTPKPHHKSLFTMTVKDESVSVLSKGKREGRHLASQALLQRFHPHISTWSGILKLYGPGSKPDRKMDQEIITELQSREKGSVKNSLIDLLKTQMKSLAEEWDENGELHKGKFYIAPSQLPFIDFHPDSLNENQVE